MLKIVPAAILGIALSFSVLANQEASIQTDQQQPDAAAFTALLLSNPQPGHELIQVANNATLEFCIQGAHCQTKQDCGFDGICDSTKRCLCF